MNDFRVAESTLLTWARNFSLQSDKDVQNGAIVGKGDLLDDENSIYEAIEDTTDGMYLVLNPAWSYEDSRITDQNEENYINVANKPFRVYELKKDMKFKIYNMTETFAQGDGIAYDFENDVFTTDNDSDLKVVAVEEVGFPYCIGELGAPVPDDNENYYGYATGSKTIKYTIEKVK